MIKIIIGLSLALILSVLVNLNQWRGKAVAAAVTTNNVENCTSANENNALLFIQMERDLKLCQDARRERQFTDSANINTLQEELGAISGRYDKLYEKWEKRPKTCDTALLEMEKQCASSFSQLQH